MLKLQRSTIMDTVFPTVARESEKALQWRQTSSLAANTTGNFPCCPPLPIYCQAVNSQTVDKRWQRGYWALFSDLCMNAWQNDRNHSFGFWEKRALVVRRNKPPLYNTSRLQSPFGWLETKNNIKWRGYQGSHSFEQLDVHDTFDKLSWNDGHVPWHREMFLSEVKLFSNLQ